MPTQELQRLLRGSAVQGCCLVPVTTTSASKEEAFGRLRILLQQGRLALPRHPRLLGQLSALEFEERESGTVRIEVPQRMGHDDLAMALALAAGVGDVASKAASARLLIPEGDLPPLQLVRDHHRFEPPPVVVKEGQQRPTDRLLSFAVARKHRGYSPPATWR